MSNFQIHELNSVAVNRNSNIIHDTEVSTDEWDTGKDIAGAVADLANANVAAPYDTTVTYAIGQYCLYEGNIYRCIAITTGVFDSTKWTQIVVTGEFRRVVELTSAQYSVLSSAEKNNGTLYILTDEETTADDIPYSAGVSVADKLSEIKVDELTFNTAINTTMGAFYRSAFITVDISSYGFTNPPKIFMQPLSGNAYPIGTLVLAQSITATSFQFAFVSGQSSTADDVETFIFMHGN